MSLEEMQLWQSTLGYKGDSFEASRERLRASLSSFRQRVAHLVASISSELPSLTVHDISHLDALWRVAREIAGGDYPINPAEAYVLGGAFLLHDAAHTVAAFPGGVSDVKTSTHWKDLIAQRYGGNEPPINSPQEREALFQVLRHLHATQARHLPHASWPDAISSIPVHLIEDQELRNYYGDLIGEIAESHHWPSHKVAESFADRIVPAPAFLQPAAWTVDVMKVSYLLRTADASHIDSLRAPWFLFALKQPSGISKDHWRFQAKMGQPVRNADGYLILSSGAPFSKSEQRAWWLAYETGRMIDRELRDAYAGLRDNGRQPFSATGVLGANAPEAFSRQVRTNGWEPVNVEPIVGDVPKLITVLGGSALYGNDKSIVVRELIQNSMDAIRALRVLGVLQEDEGEIEIAIEPGQDSSWIHVTDNGIGMGRHVLTRVLLDFGNSLWKSDSLREELPGLASKNFCATGQFGIGFYSVFMLASHVRVTTRRFDRKAEDSAEQWQLIFEDGLSSRPLLVQPTHAERLVRHGTKISLLAGNDDVLDILMRRRFRYAANKSLEEVGLEGLTAIAARLAPASDIRLYSKFGDHPRIKSVEQHDWVDLSDEDLCKRVNCSAKKLHPVYESDVLIGRLALDNSYMSAASIVWNGLLCGTSPRLSGVALARSNNSDAKRSEVTPAGSIDAWRKWAALIRSSEELSSEDLWRLHPLFPSDDFALWLYEGALMTLDGLMALLVDCNEVMLHNGAVTHEDYDEMGADYFDELIYEPEIVCAPNTAYGEREFPWFLQVDAIDYLARFEEALTECWGNFARYEDETELVGTVRGAEIFRDVTRYVRKETD